MLFDSPNAHLIFGTGIEDTFIPQEAVGQRKLDEYELTQHYAYWREDLKMVADAGAKYIRWGIPWYLLEPENGHFDFSWIDEVVDLTEKLGLEVIVDLLHYGTPMWMTNTFLNPSYPEYFARYAKTVAERYRGKFTFYTPTNEPMVNALRCGRDGFWPPYLHGNNGLVTVLTALAKGMCLATEAIRNANPEAVIVHVDAGFRWTGDCFPSLSKTQLDDWRFLATDFMLGRIDEFHPLRDYLNANGVNQETYDWFLTHRQRIDVMGVNYYPATSTCRLNEQGIEIPVEGGAEGLADLLSAYWNRYHLPIVVTETSRNESTEAKEQWLHESVAVIERLRTDGVQIVGYTWFPFFDLVDWSYRDLLGTPDEYWNPLGLVRLKRDASNMLRRIPSSAVDVFRNYANGQDEDIQTTGDKQ